MTTPVSATPEQLLIPGPPPAAVEALVVDYAGPLTGRDPLRHAVAAGLVPLSVLSGLCVGAALLAVSSDNTLGLLHVAIFATTVVQGVRVGMRLQATGAVQISMLVLDLVALVGLILLGLAPIGYALMEDSASTRGLIDDVGLRLLGLAYLLIGTAVPRHVLLYRRLAHWAADAGRWKLAGNLRALGWIKAVYEGAWLAGCCGGALMLFDRGSSTLEDFAIYLAVGAFLGCIGYGGIWIWMIIVHARLARVLRPPIASNSGHGRE